MNASSHVPAILLAALLLAAGATARPAAAAADDVEVSDLLFSSSQCSPASLCLWTAASYGGTFVDTFSTAVYDTGIVTARSVRNRALTAARIYSGPDGTGTSRCYAPGTSVRSTSVTARSFRILGSTQC